MERVENWILSYLLNSLCQAPIWFAAGWLMARALRPFGARIEHRVWVITLLLQTGIPVVFLAPAAWTRSLLFWVGEVGRNANANVSTVIGGGSVASGWSGFHAWLTLAGSVYTLGCLWFAGRFLWRATRLLALRREATQLEFAGPAALSWTQCCGRFGIRGVSLAVSSGVHGPVTMGIRSRLVLFPGGMAESLPPEDLQAVFAHECAHLHRHDFAKNLTYELLSLPVAYHPLTWLVRRRITETREMICDEMAAGMTGRSVYTRTLLRLAALIVKGMPTWTPHAIGILDTNTFERRLMNLSVKQNQPGRGRRIAAIATCAVLTIVTSGVAVALAVHVDEAPAAASTSKSHRLSISSREMSGNVLNKVPPQYPPDAKKAKIHGKVVLRAVIGKDGSIENLSVLSGPKELQQSSLDAVRQWTYKPYLLNGDPVEVETTISVIYSLAG